MGVQPKPKMSTARETPLDMPRKMPPTRAPIKMSAKTINSCRMIKDVTIQTVIRFRKDYIIVSFVNTKVEGK